MSETATEQAEREIDESLRLSKFSMRRVGISFQRRKREHSHYKQKMVLIISVTSICYHVFSEIVYIGLTLSNAPKVEEVVPLFHTCGYGLLSIVKVFMVWYKKDIFEQLITELADVWPTSPLNDSAQAIKDSSLSALHITHLWYFGTNLAGIWFYNLTPINMYLYQLWQGIEDAQIGFVWDSWYPFDKHQLVIHFAVYIFEAFAGLTCVWIMTGTDLLFTAMASHITLLLKLLHNKIETLAESTKSNEEYYKDIVEEIKLHQRLIKYCNDLEKAFAVSNFVNYVLSSINICCVVFVIVLLEPFVAISNKLYLSSALIQIGMICWYGDDILHANSDIAMAVYNSRWYQMSPKCRRALLFTMQRAQKPIAFTAMKFANISLQTYSSILTRSYSYFALLYTMYSETNI